MSLARKFLTGVGLLLLALVALAARHLWPAFFPPENIDIGTAAGEQVPISKSADAPSQAFHTMNQKNSPNSWSGSIGHSRCSTIQRASLSIL